MTAHCRAAAEKPASAEKAAALDAGAVMALVVFSGRTELRWLRFLKSGFRHCFVYLFAAEGWIVCDPMAHRTEISVVEPYPIVDLSRWLEEQGNAVVPYVVRPVPRRQAPWRPYTCVEAVKRVLGIQAGWVLTPWQLYRHLKKYRSTEKIT